MRGLLIFDKDGTLFDFEATWSVWTAGVLAELAEGAGISAADLGARIGFGAEGFAPDSPVIAGTLDEIVAHLLPLLPDWEADALEEMLATRAETAPAAEVVPLRPFFEGLRAAGWKLAVMTNDVEASARAHLGGCGALDAVDLVVGADSGHGAKPDAAPLLAIARLLNERPERAVMVGDSLHDLAAGRAAGMACVGVLTGLAPRAQLAPHADVVLASIAELPQWLAARA